MFRPFYKPKLPPLQHELDAEREDRRRSIIRPAHGRQQSGHSGDWHSQDPHERVQFPQDGDLVDVDRWGFPEPAPEGRSNSMDLERVQDNTARKIPHTRTVSFSAVPDATQPGDRARSVSIHLERFDSSDGETIEGRVSAGADYALRDAERVRRLAEQGGAAAVSPHGRRPSSIAQLQLQDGRGNPVMVPMPDSPSNAMFARPGSSLSGHRMSVVQSPSRPDPEADEEEILRNPFELPAPPPELGSRFDPKTLDAQRKSIDLSRLSLDSGVRPSMDELNAAGDPDAVRPSIERRASLVYSDDGNLTNQQSSAPDEPERIKSRIFDDIPSPEEYGRPLRPPKYQSHALLLRRQELMRPKNLIMPTFLEGTEQQKHSVHVPEGFTLGEKPLPADARASILNMGLGVPLSLSQRTFRSSLMVGGQRDEAEFFAGHAAEEGEIYRNPGQEYEDEQEFRKPGKLYVSGEYLGRADMFPGHKSYRSAGEPQAAAAKQAARLLRRRAPVHDVSCGPRRPCLDSYRPRGLC